MNLTAQIAICWAIFLLAITLLDLTSAEEWLPIFWKFLREECHF